MGYRTVVMLSNDRVSEWENDPELGKKISRAMGAGVRALSDKTRVGEYGEVVECVHGDTQTLAVLDGYSMFNALARKNWASGETSEDVALRLLKEAADKLGYRLTKKPQTKGGS